MKQAFSFCVMLLAWVALQAQTVELKDISGSGQNKFKKTPKRIYIAEFRVNYQLLFSQVEKAEGGREIGGGYRGDAKAGLTMAVQGIEASDLLEITDKLYTNYVRSLKSAGYEIIPAGNVAGAKGYTDWERKKGGTINEAQYAGFITVIPTEYEYYVKRTKEGGKEKTGFIDNILSISDDIDAPVIKVNILVPFVEDAESGASKALGKAVGGVAKVVARPYLRIEKDIISSAQTKVMYGFKEGMGIQALTNLCLKSNVDIPGIFEDKKYKAAESADTDMWGTQVGALTLFNVSDKYLSKTHPIPCDASKYKSEVYKAMDSYLTATLNEFLSFVK